PYALELIALVLQGEIGMTGGRDGDPADLTLDPQVGQARIGPDRATDRARDLADAEDPDPERAWRCRGCRAGSPALPGRPPRADGPKAGLARVHGHTVPARECPVGRILVAHRALAHTLV